MAENKLIVDQGKRSLWQILLAAGSFTVAAYSLYIIIRAFVILEINQELVRNAAKMSRTICFYLVLGIGFSIRKSMYIDLTKNILVSKFFVGPISWKKKDVVPELEYISVFMDLHSCFQVNLWYKGNKHFNMYIFDGKPEAMEFAKDVAQKLNINLLDATKKNDSKWIELPANG